MSLLDTVNNMRENITRANAIVAQLNPLHSEFQESLKSIEGLDKTQMYFGVNANGTATILDFDPTPGPSCGAPRFNIAQPLPAEAPAPVTEAQEVQ